MMKMDVSGKQNATNVVSGKQSVAGLMIYVIFVSNIVTEALCDTESCHVHLSQPVKVMSKLSWDLSKVSPAIQ